MSTDTKTPPTKAVAKHDYDRPVRNGVAGLQEMGKAIVPHIAAALPAMMAQNAPRMVRALLTECQKTPALLECTPKSLFGAVVQIAQLGLELGGHLGQAYLLPFGKKKDGVKEATLVIGYKGFITLAHRAGCPNFTPRVVREGDVFQLEYGTNQFIKHAPALSGTGAVYGYYAVVKTPAGGTDFVFLTKAQAEEHRDRYALMKTGGPWSNNFDEMAMKTCIRLLAKRVPLSPEWVQAAALEEMAADGVPQQLSTALVLEAAEPPPPEPSLRERLDRAKQPTPVASAGTTPDANIELDADGNPIFGADVPGALFGNETGEAPKH